MLDVFIFFYLKLKKKKNKRLGYNITFWLIDKLMTVVEITFSALCLRRCRASLSLSVAVFLQ
jgi:hypothetical protein